MRKTALYNSEDHIYNIWDSILLTPQPLYNTIVLGSIA